MTIKHYEDHTEIDGDNYANDDLNIIIVLPNGREIQLSTLVNKLVSAQLE
jgi:hypothetical protein